MKYPVEYNKTVLEKQFLSILPKELRDASQITFDHRRAIELIYDNLKRIYGDALNPETALNKYYFNSKGCNIVNCLDDIPTLSTEELRALVEEEDVLTKRIAEVNTVYDSSQKTEYFAEVLGLMPTKPSFCLNDWLLGVEKDALLGVGEERTETKRILETAVNGLSEQYSDGFLETFPIVGTTMTQPRRKYFYRGENGFYGSSKPGIFRGVNGPYDNELFIRHLRMDECGYFMEEFQAVKEWDYSDVNHLAIMQHYGMKTYMMDVTSDIRIALFFACCEWSNGKWIPLSHSKTISRNAREYISKLGGDSRYGILYRCPQDIMDLKWLCDKNRFKEMIIPVGYQPFMRCKTQSAYMLLTTDYDFDLLTCRDFEKIRFELTPELCEWIYEEMHQGADIYPSDDIPDLNRYIEAVSHTKRFSRFVIDGFTESLNDKEKEGFDTWMKQNGLSVVEKVDFISPNKRRKINKKYTIERAKELSRIEPCCSPIITIT